MLMKTLQALWRGEIPLAKTFWLYGVAVNMVVGTVVLFYLDWMFYSILLGDLTPLYLTTLFGLFVLLPYQVIAWVGIWRSSNRYEGSNIWMILAKAFVILSALSTPKFVLGLLEIFSI